MLKRYIEREISIRSVSMNINKVLIKDIQWQKISVETLVETLEVLIKKCLVIEHVSKNIRSIKKKCLVHSNKNIRRKKYISKRVKRDVNKKW